MRVVGNYISKLLNLVTVFSVESLRSSSPECWEFLTVSENVILEQKSKCFLDNLIICSFSA